MGEEEGERGEAGGNYKSRQAVPRYGPTSPLLAAPRLKRKRRRAGSGRWCALECWRRRRGERGGGLRRGRGIVRGAGPSLSNPAPAGRPGEERAPGEAAASSPAAHPELWRRGGLAAVCRGAGVSVRVTKRESAKRSVGPCCRGRPRAGRGSSPLMGTFRLVGRRWF